MKDPFDREVNDTTRHDTNTLYGRSPFAHSICATGIACTPATHMQDKREER